MKYLITLLLIPSIGLCMTPTKMPVSDVVTQITDADFGHRVFFQTHAGVYRLKKEHPDYKNLLKKVQESRDKSKKIDLKAEVPSMEIVE